MRSNKVKGAQVSGEPQAASLHKAGKALNVIAIAVALCALAPTATMAIEFDTGNEDVKIRWDNTVKYSAGFRVKDRSAAVMGGSQPNAVNFDDGDRNFDKGLISNRFDLLSELDVQYRNFGARLSGAGWYDDVYNRSNDNPGFAGGAVPNHLSTAYNEFTKQTRSVHGRKAEFLDAFVSGRFTPGDKNLSVRLGRFTQLYGESLFFGGNGIAAAQSSPDVIKLLSLPGAQFKEIMQPIGQVSAQLQISDSLTVGGYYQAEWRKARLPGAGSYFSMADNAGPGSENLWVGPGVAFAKSADINASGSGQFGLQLKYTTGDWEFGGYLARFHDRFPQFYVRPLSGSYAHVYAEGIKVAGVSASTVFGDVNVAGEASFRDNQSLVSTGNTTVDLSGSADGRNNALFPVGRTFHAQVSAISQLAGSPVWDAATIVGELAFNRRLSITRNANLIDPNATRDAAALRVTLTPEYFQIVSGVDLQVPISLGYGLMGRTSVNGVGFLPKHGGDLTIGVKAEMRKVWQASLSYTQYLGRAGAVADGNNFLTYKQTTKDRNFISLSVQRTF